MEKHRYKGCLVSSLKRGPRSIPPGFLHCLVIPFVVFAFQHGVYNTFITTKEAVLALCASLFLVRFISTPQRVAIYRPLAAYLGLLLLSVITATTIPQAFSAFIYHTSLILCALGCVIYTNMRTLIATIGITGGLVAVHALIQYAGIDLFGIRLGSSDLIASLGHKNYAAQIQLAALPANLYMLRVNWRCGKGWLFGCMASLSSMHIAVANSRGVLLSLIFVFFTVYCIPLFRTRRREQKRGLIIAFPVLVGLCSSVMPHEGSSIPAKGVVERLQAQTLKSENRIHFYLNSLEMIKDYPFGIGLDNFQIVYPRYYNSRARDLEHRDTMILTNPHNEYLRVAIEQGILIMCIFVLWVGILLYKLYRSAHPLATPLQAILISYLLDSLVSFPLLNPASALLFWIGIALSIRIVSRGHLRKHMVCENKDTEGQQGQLTLTFMCLSLLFLMAYYGLQKYRCALYIGKGEFEKATQVCPSNYFAQFFFADYCFRAKRVEDAKKANAALLQLAPWFVQGWYQKGQIYMSVGDVREAIKAHTYALQIHPHALKNYTALADAYRIIKEWPKALEAYRIFFKNYKDPLYYGEFSARDISYTWNNYGILLLRINISEAEQAFYHSLKAYPKNTQALFNLGSIYFWRKEWEKARHCYVAALKQNPHSKDGWYNLALVEVETKNIAAARFSIQQVEKNDSTNQKLLYLKGRLAELEKNGQSAIRYYQEFLRLGKYDPKTKDDVKKRLQKIEISTGFVKQNT